MHRFARDDAGRLDVDARHHVGLDRPLAVDRVAERIDDAAQQALADRHFHDGAGALDDLAFLDLAVEAEDHDADIVDFEIERHAFDAAFEFDHLAGLHIVEAEPWSIPSPTESTWPTSESSVSWPKFWDLVPENCGNFCGADIH